MCIRDRLLNAIRGVEDDKNVPENIVLEALTEAVAKAFKKDSELQDIEVKAEINKKSKTIDIYQYYNCLLYTSHPTWNCVL